MSYSESDFGIIIEHQHCDTCRVQYIQEVILPTPSLFEENLLSSLNSFILFNKSEIVKAIQVIHKINSYMYIFRNWLW